MDVINNLQLPYNGPISGGVMPNKIIRLRGRTNNSVKRFVVNLQRHSTSQTQPDNILHLSVRMNGDIIRNSLINGVWGAEEGVADGNPIIQGTPFELAITCLTEQYLININGNKFCEFKHRVPLNELSHIHIYSEEATDTIIDQLSYETPSSNPNIVLSPVIPYVGAIPDKYIVDKTVKIQGVIPQGTDRVRINLEIRYPQTKTKDVALHMVIRIANNFIILNSKVKGTPGEELRIERMPFRYGEPFELEFSCEPDQFQIYINKQHLQNFSHRFPPQNITHLKIDKGPVTINQILYENVFSIDPRSA